MREQLGIDFGRDQLDLEGLLGTSAANTLKSCIPNFRGSLGIEH